MDETKDNELSSVKKAFRILEFIRDSGSVTLSEVTSALSLPKSTAHRYLSTLVAAEYVVRDGDEYELSYAFLSFANHIRARDPATPLLEAKVEELADRTGELVQFITEEYDRAVYLLQASGGDGVQVGTYAKTFGSLHSTAGGKAILSTWPRAEVEDFLDRRGLEPVTDWTITDRGEFLAEIEAVADRGYSVNDQENLEGLIAVSVPVCDPDGRAIGALSVAGPANRMNREMIDSELPDLLLNASNELELNLRLL